MLEDLLKRDDRTVISVGGGLPLRDENRELLWKLGTVVYLQVKPETILERLAKDEYQTDIRRRSRICVPCWRTGRRCIRKRPIW